MISKTNKISHKTLTILALLTLTSIAVNTLFLKISYYNIILYSLGALIYFISIKISRAWLRTGVDYIQSGEAAIETFVIFLVIKFISSDIYSALFITTITVILLEFFSATVINSKDKEQFTLGSLINIIIIIYFIFFAFFDNTFNSNGLREIVLGYGHVESINNYIIPTLSIVFLILYYLSFKLSHEASLFSLGKSYFETSGLNYKTFHLVVVPIKGIIITLTFFLVGWLGGIGAYIQNPNSRGTIITDIGLILILLIYVQIILSFSVYLDYKYIILISTILSYTFYIYRTSRDNYL